MKKFFYGFLYFSIILNQFLAADQNNSLPFIIGEKLEYDLSWGFIPVGLATMEVHSIVNYDKKSCILLKFFVRTNSFADSFYKVRTTIESVISQDVSKSLSYRKAQQEGKTKKNIFVKFDYDKLKAFYREENGASSSIPIPVNVFDPLAIAYSFRLKELHENQTIQIPTCDGKNFRQMLIKTGKRKVISVPAGKFSAIETIPEMKNLKGVFQKSPEGILRVWYSQDKSKLPVKISSKVIVGSFNAKLRRIKAGIE